MYNYFFALIYFMLCIYGFCEVIRNKEMTSVASPVAPAPSNQIVFIGNAAGGCGVGFYTTSDTSGIMYAVTPGMYSATDFNNVGVNIANLQTAQSTPSCSAVVTFADGSTSTISGVDPVPIGGTSPTQITVTQAASSERFSMPTMPSLVVPAALTSNATWVLLILLILVVAMSLYYYYYYLPTGGKTLTKTVQEDVGTVTSTAEGVVGDVAGLL
jgi:hypothetical protein